MKTLRLAATLVGLLAAAPLLAACHTTAGVGQDLSQGGQALTNTAKANTPATPSQ
jgi:predicted small secreted protein